MTEEFKDSLLARIAQLEEDIARERQINAQLSERMAGLGVEINHHATRLGTIAASATNLAAFVARGEAVSR